MGFNHNLLQSRVNFDVPPKQDQTDMPEVTMKFGQHLHFFYACDSFNNFMFIPMCFGVSSVESLRQSHMGAAMQYTWPEAPPRTRAPGSLHVGHEPQVSLGVP